MSSPPLVLILVGSLLQADGTWAEGQQLHAGPFDGWAVEQEGGRVLASDYLPKPPVVVAPGEPFRLTIPEPPAP